MSHRNKKCPTDFDSARRDKYAIKKFRTFWLHLRLFCFAYRIFNGAVSDYKASDGMVIGGRIVGNNRFAVVLWFSIRNSQSRAMLLSHPAVWPIKITGSKSARSFATWPNRNIQKIRRPTPSCYMTTFLLNFTQKSRYSTGGAAAVSALWQVQAENLNQNGWINIRVSKLTLPLC